MPSSWQISWSHLLLPWLVMCGLNSAEDSSVRRIPLRSHGLSAPYLDSDMQSRFFDFGGDTIIRADQYIRLTADRPSQSGWLFSKLPLSATNWEIEVEFKIHGLNTLHGDGMAIWVTKQRAASGTVFGSTDKFDGLGVFIDTYKNHRPGTIFPYVMAMIGNESITYDKDNDGKANELAGCSARGIRTASFAPRARLTYMHETSLRLELMYKAPEEWTECFETGPVTLPNIGYLGFSAETGELSDNHDILSVTTHNLHVAQEFNNRPGDNSRQRQKDATVRTKNRGQQGQGGSWSMFFVKVILFILVCGAAYVGFTVHRTKQRGSRF